MSLNQYWGVGGTTTTFKHIVIANMVAIRARRYGSVD